MSRHNPDLDDAADVFREPEPWDPIESKLVAWSFGLAFVSLIVFGVLINLYILD